jgi:DNA-binding protein HU-beta
LPESKRSGQTSSAKLVKELFMPSDTATLRTTVTLKQMAAEVAEGHDLSKKQAETALSALMALATRHLQNGDKIRLTGLGVLQVQDRPARVGRNPATGEVIEIKASKKIAFRAAKELKEAV